MQFKKGVDPKHLSAPAWYGLHKADQIHRRMASREAVCTSTGEGKHRAERSMHYTGEYGRGWSRAFDLRIWHVDPPEYARRLKLSLGKDYVVLLEQTHIHVHWAPVR